MGIFIQLKKFASRSIVVGVKTDNQIFPAVAHSIDYFFILHEKTDIILIRTDLILTDFITLAHGKITGNFDVMIQKCVWKVLRGFK